MTRLPFFFFVVVLKSATAFRTDVEQAAARFELFRAVSDEKVRMLSDISEWVRRVTSSSNSTLCACKVHVSTLILLSEKCAGVLRRRFFSCYVEFWCV